MTSNLSDRTQGFFEIPRVQHDISFDDFYRDYFQTETPVVIECAGQDWPALKKWDIAYLRKRLAGESSVKNISLFLLLDSDLLADDFSYPPFMEKLNHDPDIFPYKSNARIWINSKNNVSQWHFDSGVVNNFNTQIVGRKEWTLISPQTPPDCYPFSNFVILEDEKKILKNKIFTRTITNPGDMIYLPPLWYHAVRSLEEKNINLMWVYTKRKASVLSPSLIRDEPRYRIHWYLSRHRHAVVRDAYAYFLSRIPGFLKVTWHFDSLIETDIVHTRLGLLRWFFKELLRLGKTVITIPRIRRSLQTSEKAPNLTAAPTEQAPKNG